MPNQPNPTNPESLQPSSNPAASGVDKAATTAPAAPATAPAATAAAPTTAPAKEAEPALKDEAKKTIAANEAAELRALKEKMKGSQADKNWTPPTGGETYMMAMAGKEATAAGKRLRNEIKALKEQQGEKRKIIATEKLNGLMEVIAKDPETSKPNEEKLQQWKEANPGKDFNKTLLDAIGEYREATGKKYQKPDKDGGQDEISAVEDKAKKCVKNDGILEKLKERFKKEPTVTAEQTATAEPVTVSPKNT